MKILIIASVLASISISALAQDSVNSSADTAPAASTEPKKFALDPKILVNEDSKEINTLFKNMIVVQKKAIERKNKWVFDSHLSFDFSDNPKTMYGTSFGVGYAILESFEIGTSFSPFILSKERASVGAVRQLRLEGGKTADLYAPDAKWEAGVHLTWIFAYGKDAFGPYSIIRSDTFLKVFTSKIKYEEGEDGSRWGVSVGKTFFISKALNFRFSAGFSRQTSFINQRSQSTNIGLIEPGFVWFL